MAQEEDDHPGDARHEEASPQAMLVEGPSALTHLDAQGRASMVDVGQKVPSPRQAVARAFVRMSPTTLQAIMTHQVAKGEVLQVARLAGIMAAKRTDELIPLCHSLGLDHVQVRFALLPEQGGVLIEASASCSGKTGVEMEAMMAASVAALTLYDMCKGLDKGMVIEQVHLRLKLGGKSGRFEHPDSPGGPLPSTLEWR